MFNPILYLSQKLDSYLQARINPMASRAVEGCLDDAMTSREVERRIEDMVEEAIGNADPDFSDDAERAVEDALRGVDIEQEVANAIDDANIQSQCEDEAEAAVGIALEELDLKKQVRAIILEAHSDALKAAVEDMARASVDAAIKRALLTLAAQFGEEGGAR